MEWYLVSRCRAFMVFRSWAKVREMDSKSDIWVKAREMTVARVPIGRPPQRPPRAKVQVSALKQRKTRDCTQAFVTW